jgi:hypothetical protein
MHPSSVAVSHEHRRAKTDRLDTVLRGYQFRMGGRGAPIATSDFPTICAAREASCSSTFLFLSH